MNSDQPAPPSRPTPSWPGVTPLSSQGLVTAPTPPARLGPDSAGPEREICTVVLLDTARSARTDCQGQRRMRDDLYDLIRGAVEYAGVALESLHPSDTGDGMRFIVPYNLIQPTHVVDLFVLGLAAGLREHRRRVSESARIRLRVGFDLGLVERHRQGWTGDPLVRVVRLVDAEPARQALRTDRRVDLVAMVSDVLYDFAIGHGYGYIAPDSFQLVRVRVKEFDRNAWLYKPPISGACGRCDSAAA